MIKLIALDLDGTLLDSEKRYPKDFPAFVKEHPEILFVLASGRQYYTLKQQFDEICPGLVYIAENGAAVFRGDELIYEDTMSPEDARCALDAAKKIEGAWPYILCGLQSAYVNPADSFSMEEGVKYYARLRTEDDIYPFANSDRICKLALFFRDKDAQRAYDRLPRMSSSISGILSGDRWIDIGNKTVGKGNALRALREHYGIKKEECMCFGDYLNDMTLFEECEESYAMANAHDDLKKAAKHVTGYSNDEDGVMKALHQVFG
ncbi:MAG: HAD family phosphatase [Clostridiales bacterium]|nr:HAD family phosphatase [Clostridiales bacterium]